VIDGGAVGGDGWTTYFAVVGAVVLVGILLLGGVAWAVAGRARGAVLGLAVFFTAFWVLAGARGGSAERAIGVGIVLALGTAALLRAPEARGDQAMGAWRRRLSATTAIAVVVGIAVVVLQTENDVDRQHAIDVTTDEARAVADELATAPSATTTAQDLAVLVATPTGGPGAAARVALVSADGDRRVGGAILVLQLEDRLGAAVTRACWRFEVHDGTPVDAASARCPAHAVAEEPSNYDDLLYQPIAALPAAEQTDATAVEEVATEAIPRLLGDDAEVDVEVIQVSDGVVGIAASLDATRCLVTTLRATPGGTSIATQHAPAEALGSGGVGCRASLAG